MGITPVCGGRGFGMCVDHVFWLSSVSLNDVFLLRHLATLRYSCWSGLQLSAEAGACVCVCVDTLFLIFQCP